MEIKYVKHQDIDKDHWDAGILKAINGLIYANSWYLDIVSPGWEALIGGDYEALFPLPAKKKMGIPYLSHPLFTQQLGLFSSDFEKWKVDDFLKAIPLKYRKYRLCLNADSKPVNYSYNVRINHILEIEEYERCASAYNQNTKRNLKKVQDTEGELDKVDKLKDFMALSRDYLPAELDGGEWKKMESLMREILKRDLGFIVGVFEENQLESAVFFANWKNRISYLFSSSSLRGKELRSSFLIVDSVIQQFASQGKVLDFEGSMDENISRFFKGFGAQEELYYELIRKF